MFFTACDSINYAGAFFHLYTLVAQEEHVLTNFWDANYGYMGNACTRCDHVHCITICCKKEGGFRLTISFGANFAIFAR